MTKLLKFITPLTICATSIAPFITSCKKQSVVYEFDLTKPFAPTIAKLGGKLNQAQATQKYFDDVSNQNEIIANDIAYTGYQIGYPTIGYTKLTIKSISVDSKNFLLSATLFSDGGVEDTADIMVGLEIKFENIPFTVCYDLDATYGSNGGTSPKNDFNWFLNNDNGHFYQKEIYETGDDIIHDGNKQKLVDDPEKEANFMLIFLGIAFSSPSLSYYLSETELE